MLNPQTQSKEKNLEFVAVMALLMSIVALSIDSILPALSTISGSFGVAADNLNETQLLLTTMFLGMAFGLMIYGPLSDTFGRKKIIYLGVSIFALGTIISLLAENYNMMLLGRTIQGFGAASCRVISIAMIRDRFEGNEMGKVMSLITTIFIIVPAIAPSIGQGILLFSHWRSIFIFLLIISIISVIWLHIRQPETLSVENRRSFSLKSTGNAIKETINNPISRTYTIASGLIFGGFVGYLNSAQQILQSQYHLGNTFSLVFGGLALVIGIASYFNAKLLNKFGMERLCIYSLFSFSFVSLAFCLYVHYSSEQVSLTTLVIYLAFVFFNLGLLIGNFNTLALKPLGHIAGTAVSVISSIQTLLSVVIGSVIGLLYDNSILPLIVGFTFTSLGALIMTLYYDGEAVIKSQSAETIQ
jgi:DHA1 family bicyclomycin/chloramphenicol resistance-like MFS transporter